MFCPICRKTQLEKKKFKDIFVYHCGLCDQEFLYSSGRLIKIKKKVEEEKESPEYKYIHDGYSYYYK